MENHHQIVQTVNKDAFSVEFEYFTDDVRQSQDFKTDLRRVGMLL